MGVEVGPWEGLATAIADTLYEMAGYLVVRTTAPYVSGAATITVESTDRFPSSGKIVFGGKVVNYTGVTTTSFTGLTDAITGDVGTEIDLATGETVMEWGRLSTQIDQLRASFLLPYAEDVELDILARNYGIARVRGLDDDTFRAVLRAWIYLEAQTMYGCEQILDALFGVGNYTLYEDLETYDHTVFVVVPPLNPNTYRGKAFLCGGESQARDTLTTVSVQNPVLTVYGVYDEADPTRIGTNFAHAVLACSTAAAQPVRLTSVGLWLASDEGKPVVIDSVQHWVIAEYIDANTLRLGGRERTDGTLDASEPDELVTDYDWWAPWMVGHRIVITSDILDNDGTYTIAEVINAYTIRLAGATFLTETDVTYELIPDFGNDASVSAEILRATWVGNVITTPQNLPADVLVDYTAIPSAELVEIPALSGNDQYPFYLWDDAYIAQTILDLITAAGVRVLTAVE